MALGSVVREARSKGSLKGLLAKAWRKQVEKPPILPDDFIRASGLASLCSRAEVLRSVHKVTDKETQDAGLLLTFLHGTSLHWGLQNHALAEIDVLYGMWKCIGCGVLHGTVEKNRPIPDTVILRPKVCKCGGNEFQYHEHQFINEEFRLTGHADGFVVIPGLPGMGILEAKSIGGKGAWEVKHGPKIDHVIQAQTYMWLSGLRWAIIFYWSKGEMGLDAISEYVIERDDETIFKIQETIRDMRNGLRTGILPTRICSDKDCPKAKYCPVVKQCFAEN